MNKEEWVVRRWSILFWAVAVFLVPFGLVGLPAGANQAATPAADGTPATADRAATPVADGTPEAEIAGVETFEIESAAHEEGPIDHPQRPPVGGPHAQVWQDCGFYDAPIRSENAVHLLEHGAVWVTYNPALPAAEVETLRRLAADEPYLLVSPFPDLPSAVVASAWDKQLRLDSADDARLEAFIAAFAGRGLEEGAPCDGGTTETVAAGSDVAA